MRSIATIVLVVSIAGRAAAQPADPPAPPPAPAELSETTAVALSVAPTLVAWTFLIATTRFHDDNRVALPFAALGVLVAPSLGQWYADSPWTRGLALRAVGLLSFGVAVSQTTTCDERRGCHSERLSNGLAIAAVAMYAAGTVDDIVRAPGAVRRHNERLRGVTVVPVLRRDAGGLALAAQF